MSAVATVRRSVITLVSAVAVGALVFGLVAALAPAGAQEPGGAGEEALEPPGPADREARRAEVRECLAGQGIELPAEGEGRGFVRGLDETGREELRSALEACGVDGNGHVRARRHLRRHHAALRTCITDQGVELPRPGMADDGSRTRPELTDEQQAALDACREQFDTRRAELRSCIEGQGIELPAEGERRGFVRGLDPAQRDELRAAFAACRPDAVAQDASV